LVAGFTVTRERASSIYAILCGSITAIGTLRALVEVGARCTRARVASLALAGITRGLVGTSRVRIAHGRWCRTLVNIHARSARVPLVADFAVTRERARVVYAILCGAITAIGTLRALVEVGTRCTRARVARIACTRIAGSMVGTSSVRIASSRSCYTLVDIDAGAVLVLLVAGFTVTSKRAGVVSAIG
jgi:hypothetical protein